MEKRIIYVYDNDTQIDRVNYDVCSEIGRIESAEAVPVSTVAERFMQLKPKGYKLKLDRKCDGVKIPLPNDIRSKLIELINN